MTFRSMTLLMVLLTLGSTPSWAMPAISVDWDPPVGLTATGDLDGTLMELEFAGLGNSPLNIFTVDLSTADFAAGPLSSSAETIAHPSIDTWTLTSDQPINDLLVYVVFWRGDQSQTSTPPNVSYEFDRSFTILWTGECQH